MVVEEAALSSFWRSSDSALAEAFCSSGAGLFVPSSPLSVCASLSGLAPDLALLLSDDAAPEMAFFAATCGELGRLEVGGE